MEYSLLLVVVYGKKYLLAFKDFYVCVITFIDTHTAKGEIFGNKRINQRSHGLCFFALPYKLMSKAVIATKERPRRVRPMRAIQFTIHL